MSRLFQGLHEDTETVSDGESENEEDNTAESVETSHFRNSLPLLSRKILFIVQNGWAWIKQK